ncbi:MAG: uroporphyrinogen decarboxylase family protein [Melioribacteraceae bacterium]
MNSFERILATAQGASVDRKPFSLLLSLYGAGIINAPLKEYYSNSELYYEGQCAVYETFKPDFIFAPFSIPLLGAAFGSELKYFEDFPPNLRKPVFSNLDEIRTLPPPKAENFPKLKYFLDIVQKLSSKYTNQAPVAAITLNPVDLPIVLFGLDKWLEIVLFDKTGTKKVLDYTIPFCLDYNSSLLANGTTFLVMPPVFLNPSIVTREIVENFLPIINSFNSETKGYIINHSGGTRYLPFIDLYKDSPNTIAYVVSGNEDLKIARDKLGPKKILAGNIDGPELINLSPERIYKKTMEILELMQDDPYFIFATSNADIPLKTPIENIRMIKEAIKEKARITYGRS